MSLARMLSPLALLACVGCGGPERPLSVLLVSLDTTRADRIGAYGYAHAGTPNLDSLAERGVLFEHAYAPVPLTLPSHTSLLTGAGPRTHGVRDNGRFKVHSGMTTLAELAAARGYRTAAFVAAFPLSSQFGLDQGFELYDDQFGSQGQVMAQRDGAVVAARAQSWLQTLSRDESFLLWTHFFDPHWPYEASEPFASQHAGDPYQAEIAYADAQLGKLLDALDRLGRLDDTLVVACSDHGEGLGEHGEDTHGFLVHDATLRVPLLMAGPGVPGGVLSGELAGLVDVLPTIVELADWGLPAQARGRSLVPAFGGAVDPERVLYLESQYPRSHYGYSELEAVVRGRDKLVSAPASDEPAALHDLADDPGELADLGADEPARSQALQDELDRLRERLDAAERWSLAAELDAAGAAALAQLGYSGDGPEEAVAGTLRHPRHGVRVADLSQQVTGLLNVGRFEDARPLVEELEELEPDGFAALYTRGHLWCRESVLRPTLAPRAVELLRRAVVLAPERVKAWRVLAEACGRAGYHAECARAWSVTCTLARQKDEFASELDQALDEVERELGRLEHAGRDEEQQALELRAVLDELRAP